MKKEAIQVDQAISQRERLLEERIRQLETTLTSFKTVFDPTVRGKGQGKKSKGTEEVPTTSASTRQR